MEFMSQFNAEIIYIKGNDNTVADALSWLPTNKESIHADKLACYPYAFCDDDETYGVIASIYWKYRDLGNLQQLFHPASLLG